MRVSFSQLETWRRCRQKFAWWYRDRLSAPRSVGQVRGEAGHAALALWYAGQSEEEAIGAALQIVHQEYPNLSAHEIDKQCELLQTVLFRYFAWEPDNGNWRPLVVGVEQHVELPLVSDENGELHGVQGYFDLVLARPDKDDPDAVWLVEHKFVQEARHSHLLLDPQITMYCLLYQMATGTSVKGVIYNSVRVRPGGIAEKEPARRTEVPRSQAGLQLAYHELLLQAREVVAARTQFQRGRGQELIYRNATRECHWECNLYQMCVGMELTGHADPSLLEPRSTELALEEVAG